MQPLSVSCPAPDFELTDHDGNLFSLSSLRGSKVLIYFYPKAMTPGCTVQACGLRDVNAELKACNTQVIGISPDSPARLKRFVEKQDLNFTLLADEELQVAKSFGIFGPKKFMGREFDGIHRISFLIDEQGIIQYRFDQFKTKEHADIVLDFIKHYPG